MDSTAWQAFLREWSQEVLASHEYAAELPSDVVASGWLGFAGASEEEIAKAEARIGARLPFSYREFLKVSNGWRMTTPFIDRMWSTEEIAWFTERRSDWITAWKEGERASGKGVSVSDADYFVYGPNQAEYNVRMEYLETALEISDVGDAAIYVLNPKVVTPAGEWEAWFFANWLPGANRYRSFQDLMLAEYESFKRLR